MHDAGKRSLDRSERTKQRTPDVHRESIWQIARALESRVAIGGVDGAAQVPEVLAFDELEDEKGGAELVFAAVE